MNGFVSCDQSDSSQVDSGKELDKEAVLAQNISYLNQKLNAPMSSVIQQLKRMQQNGQSEKEIQLPEPNSFGLFSSINRSEPILNNNASKFKSSLIKRGSLATRHLPNQQGKSKSESDEFQSNEEGNDADDDEDSDENVEVEELDSIDGENEDLSINQFQNAKFKQFIDNYEIPLGLNSYSGNTNTTTANLASSSGASTASSSASNQSSREMSAEKWSCDFVARWLNNNHLSHYVDTFLDQQIDGEKLLDLDSDKLKVNYIY